MVGHLLVMCVIRLSECSFHFAPKNNKKRLDTEEACPEEGTQWLFVMVDLSSCSKRGSRIGSGAKLAKPTQKQEAGS